MIQVGGVHGVGKTTTIREAKKFTSKDVPVLKGSEIIARNLGISVEEIPKLEPRIRKLARVAMFEELYSTKNGVRDGHYCVFTDQGGYEFPFDERDRGVVDVAVLITASMESVLARRLSITRERPTDPKVIERHLQLEEEAAAQFSNRLAVPLHVVENEDIGRAAVQLAQVYERYLN